MAKVDIASRKQQLLLRAKEIAANRDAQIAKIRESAGETLEELQDEMRKLEQTERQRQRKQRQRAAFVLGEFLLRDGLEDATVQAIVASGAFDTFTRSKSHRGARKIFGLPEITVEKPPAP